MTSANADWTLETWRTFLRAGLLNEVGIVCVRNVARTMPVPARLSADRDWLVEQCEVELLALAMYGPVDEDDLDVDDD